MIYQYLHDNSGKVVAQKRKPSMPDFTNHYFPATDTPASVRESYMHRLIRYIPDIDYEPVACSSRSKVSRFDLTRTINRGVMPVHVEFVRNMGSRGTMSIPVIIDGRLWGLVSFHFKLHKHVDVQRRNFLILVTSLLSAKIDQIEIMAKEQEQQQLLDAIVLFSKQYSRAEDVFTLTQRWLKKLTELVECDGYSFCCQRRYKHWKKTADEACAERIYKHYAKIGLKSVYEISFEELKSFGLKGNDDTIKAALLIIVDYEEDMYVILYRTITVEQRIWAGDPNQYIRFSKNKSQYHPRVSFETWVGVHMVASRPWSNLDRVAAEQVQQFLIEKILRKKLTEKALRDALTGLYNRFYLDEQFKREVAAAKRKNTQLSLCIIDLDHFKLVNDQYGHDCGDQILRGVAKYLLASFRYEDTVCRFGGEEFVVLMQNTDLKAAKARCEQAREYLESHPFSYKRSQIQVTLSVGVVTLTPKNNAFALDRLISRADVLLYQAKSQGRNQVVAKRLTKLK